MTRLRPRRLRPASRWLAIASLLAIAGGCGTGDDVDWSSPSIGRSDDGAVVLIGAPCSSVDLTALSVVDRATEQPIMRIEFDPPTMAWDVVVGLDPLDVDRPGFDVVELDESGLATAMTSTGDGYEIVSEIRARVDGSESRETVPFQPGRVPAGAATDVDEIVDDAAGVGCPRGGNEPWGEAFGG